MALVNTAFSLIEQGKRVLVVDFDLEAPGLPSYGAFENAVGKKGLVDYVNDYITLLQAPNVTDFISECQKDLLWLMTAGDNQSSSYTEKLNSIDWQQLYETHSGYLMFEDMKQQWSQYNGHGFDYVLIDSRTGYTDVGGICTRQLPNAVVAMFFPNEQNIDGLSSVVDFIRQQNLSSEVKTTVHFCPSNVPDLDDDEEILSSFLTRAQNRLGYSDAASVIHHYNNLLLLTQVPFVSTRPNSRLAKEYKALTKAIVSENLEDEHGAAIALEKIRNSYLRSRESLSSQRREEMRKTTEEINERHGNKPHLAWLLAQVYSAVPSAEDEIACLTVAIDAGFKVDQARFARAMRYMQLNHTQSAASDLRLVLESQSPKNFAAIPAIEMLRSVVQANEWVRILESSPFLSHMDPKIFRQVINILIGDRSSLPLARKICQQVIDDERSTLDDLEVARSEKILCLIGTGSFSEVMKLLASDRTSMLSSDKI